MEAAGQEIRSLKAQLNRIKRQRAELGRGGISPLGAGTHTHGGKLPEMSAGSSDEEREDSHKGKDEETGKAKSVGLAGGGDEVVVRAEAQATASQRRRRRRGAQ